MVSHPWGTDAQQSPFLHGFRLRSRPSSWLIRDSRSTRLPASVSRPIASAPDVLVLQPDQLETNPEGWRMTFSRTEAI